MIVDILAFVRVLADAHVDYIIVGGVAANVHGALRTTLDLDIVYSRTPENVTRLVDALTPYHPYLRGAPEARRRASQRPRGPGRTRSVTRRAGSLVVIVENPDPNFTPDLA